MGEKVENVRKDNYIKVVIRGGKSRFYGRKLHFSLGAQSKKKMFALL